MKTAVFISGNGSNLQAIIDLWQVGRVRYDLRLVVSNKANAFGLERAKKAGIKTLVVEHKKFTSRLNFDQNIYQHLQAEKIELVALAGFMRLLTPWFVQQWPGRLLNIHPSLLPAFPGLHTHRQALACGVKFSGCTVFFVDEGVDTGTIIDQAIVNVLEGDTEADLASRILAQEHIIFPRALDKVAGGEILLSAVNFKKQTLRNR